MISLYYNIFDEEEGSTMPAALRPTNVVREFTRIKHHFPDIYRNENRFTRGFECLDIQIARMVNREVIRFDDEILQALAAAGLRAYERLAQEPPSSWENLSEPVRQLGKRLVGAFDPDVNEELHAAVKKAWQTAEDPAYHFQQWGAIIRRLMTSVKFHGKRDPRGYCRWIPGFVGKFPIDPAEDRIHWVAWSKSMNRV